MLILQQHGSIEHEFQVSKSPRIAWSDKSKWITRFQQSIYAIIEKASGRVGATAAEN